MATSELVPARKPSLSPSELADAGALVAEARWNQLAADWRIFIAQGRVYAVATPQGRIVATAATLPYGGRFAWISMVLVAGEYRRRGLATQLMRRGVDDLVASQLVPILDATPDGREVYRRLGFKDSWGLQRLVRREPFSAAFAPPAGVVVRAIDDADWPALVAYDAAAFGAERGAVLAGLRGRLPAAELVATRDGRVVGFALGRDGRLAAHIGPLTADDDGIACALAARALDGLEGPVFVDLADAKSALRGYLDARGFAVARPFTRMIYGTATRFDDAARTYAVVGPEFG
ncbi:MAG TPA: GNAT family N-acetyltransferase [Xanthobacteraceae bacterium]|nr:GNAT family N-acetyltransferase [Xanthobacteraceae bacterium]